VDQRASAAWRLDSRGSCARRAADCSNDPTNGTDPSGLAPNKEGTTDPSYLLAFMRNLEQQGRSFEEILRQLRDESAGLDHRYFYTDQYGWVDIRHFAAAALTTQQVQPWLTKAAGYSVEVLQTVTDIFDSYKSAFSPEDLPSNSAGASFGAWYKNAASKAMGKGSPLPSGSLTGWLRQAGARRQNDPAAGWINLPATDPSANGGINRGSNFGSNKP
jgi:hypothetical protein